jgi:hypothetical protein
MKRLLFLLALSLVVDGCSSRLDPSQVYERAQNGLLFTQRCEAATQKAMTQCEGSTAVGCKSNVQEAQNDCSGAQDIFSALADVSAQAGGKATK